MERNELLQAALEGFQARFRKVTEQIAEIETELRGNRPAPVALGSRPSRLKHGIKPQPVVRKKRKMNAATRKRMAEAQRARWAAYHAKKNAA